MVQCPIRNNSTSSANVVIPFPVQLYYHSTDASEWIFYNQHELEAVCLCLPQRQLGPELRRQHGVVSRQGSKGDGKAIVSQQPSCYNSISLVCSLVESRLILINFPQRMQGCNVFNQVRNWSPRTSHSASTVWRHSVKCREAVKNNNLWSAGGLTMLYTLRSSYTSPSWNPQYVLSVWAKQSSQSLCWVVGGENEN